VRGRFYDILVISCGVGTHLSSYSLLTSQNAIMTQYANYLYPSLYLMPSVTTQKLSLLLCPTHSFTGINERDEKDGTLM
jgi:hypothetical protein